jgi:hypothetical protein
MTFKSEVEIEHTKIEATETGGAAGGEVAVEQAYLDWHFMTHLGLKAGLVLVPVGILNETHEPPTFEGVERSNVETYIIPTTWREAGTGIYGSVAEAWEYQLYVVAGLVAEGFSGSQGIREGRQEGLNSDATNPSLTARLQYAPEPGVKVGLSGFYGNTTGGNEALGSGTLGLIAADARATLGQAGFRAVGAYESLTDADKINLAYHNDVGDRMYGASFEGSLDILPFFLMEPDQSLKLFARYERYKTQASVSSPGVVADPANDRNDVTLGASYRPTYNTVFKADYQFFSNAADLNTKMFNLGIGYSF